jgi:molybdopterin-biosynthesis enzyme MoeA-like protein
MAAIFKGKISTAACLIIGDEVLGGKVFGTPTEDRVTNGQTVDTNSAFFAKYCFSLGIALKRIEVIADDEAEIVEAVRRMSSNYDFVVTSGGIGPT